MKSFYRKIVIGFFAVLLVITPALAQTTRSIITPENAAQMQELFFLPKQSRIINMDIVWSSDGAKFGIAGGGGVQVYGVDDNFRLLQQLGSDESKRTVAFNQDATLVAASDGTTPIVWLWDTETGEKAATIDVGQYYTEDILFSPDGTWLATTDLGHSLSLWMVKNSAGEIVPFTPANAYRVERQMRLGDEDANVLAMVSSGDGSHLYSAEASDRIVIWNVQTGHMETTFEHPDLWTALAVHEEKQLIASGGWGGDVRIWDMAGNLLAKIMTNAESPVDGVAFNPAGNLLAVVSNDGTVRVYDIREVEQIGDPLFTAVHSHIVSDVAFSPDGTLLATMGTDDGVRFWGIGAPISLLLPPTPTPSPTATATPIPVLMTGGNALVHTTDGDILNVRSGPGRSFDIVAKLPNDTPVVLIDGPQEADGFRWWKLRTDDGIEGWAVEVAEDEQTLIPTSGG